MNRPDTPAGHPAADGTRTELAVRWIAWHSFELSTVATPLILAVTVDGWLALISVAAGGVWAVSEWLSHQKRRDIRALTGAATTTRQLSTAAASADRRDETKGAHA